MSSAAVVTGALWLMPFILAEFVLFILAELFRANWPVLVEFVKISQINVSYNADCFLSYKNCKLLIA